MASTFTPNINLEKPGNGEQDGSWGDTVNANMDKVDTAVAARVKLTEPNQTITGNVTVTGAVEAGAIRSTASSSGYGEGVTLHNRGANATANRGMDITFNASTNGSALGGLALIRATTTTAANNTGNLLFYATNGGTANLGMTVKSDGSVNLPVRAEIGDVNFFASIPVASTPRMTFDSGDYIQYSRTSDALEAYVGGTLRFGVNASGPYRETDAASANQLVRKSQLDTATAQATVTSNGTVELATTAETAAGTDGQRAITPAGFKGAFTTNQTLSTTGRQVLPGGLTLMWGSGSIASPNTAVNGWAPLVTTTFPGGGFSTACVLFLPVLTSAGSTGAEDTENTVSVGTLSTTQGQILIARKSGSNGSNTETVGYMWFAIGY